MIANSPLPPSSRAASSVSVLPMPFRRRLVDEEVARVGLGVGVPGQDLDAALARLAQHRRDAAAVLDRHGDRVHPRVIQFSTSSFCLAASRPVGPSQISSTPSSLRRLLGAGAAADEVRIALGLRHHRDDRSACRRRRRCGGRPAAIAGPRRRLRASAPARRWCRRRSASRRGSCAQRTAT